MSNSNTSSSYVDVGAPASPGSDASGTSSNLLVSEHLRPIILSSSTNAGATFVRVPVPFEPSSAWVAAEVVRDEFHRYLAKNKNADAAINAEQEQQAAQDAAEGDDEEVDTAKAAAASRGARAVLFAKFFGFLAQKLRAIEVSASTHEVEVLYRAWIQFRSEFLGTDNDIHNLVYSIVDIEQRPIVLRDYFEAFVLLEKLGKVNAKSLSTPKLFGLIEQQKAQAFAVFGGQGNNEVSSRIWSPLSPRLHY